MTACRDVRWGKKKGSESWEKVGGAGIQTKRMEDQKTEKIKKKK